MKEIIDVNGDIIETYTDLGNGKFAIGKHQDVSGYLNKNQRERNEAQSGWKGDMHKVASIPLVLVEKWCKEAGCNVLEPKNRHILMAKLRDRDFSKLRTKEGKI
jgi:hypothetical protein